MFCLNCGNAGRKYTLLRLLLWARTAFTGMSSHKGNQL